MIRVEITDDLKLNAKAHELTMGEKIVNSLREAGVPVTGFFTVRGVSHGTLVYESQGSKHTFRWRENQDDRETTGFIRSTLKNGVVVFKNGKHAEEDDEL